MVIVESSVLTSVLATSPTVREARKSAAYSDTTRTPRRASFSVMIEFCIVAQDTKYAAAQPPRSGSKPIGWRVVSNAKTTDANDTIYHFRASEDYDPSARLGEIVAPLLAINSADDFVNPPELPMMRAMIGQVKRGTFVLVPISEDTRGHGTHSQPLVFGPYLAEFLKTLAP